MVPYTLATSREPLLHEQLLESLQRMAAAGHQPGRYVVVRLTDGRVRGYAMLDEHSSPFELISQIRNESGPLSSAFLVGSKVSQGAVRVFVEDLLGDRRLEQYAAHSAGRTLWNPVTAQLPAPPSHRPRSAGFALAGCSRPFTMIAAG